MTKPISTRSSAPQTSPLPDIHTRPIAPPVYQKPSLNTEQAANLLIGKKIQDRHLDGTTNILYEFFSTSKSENMHWHTPGEFNANQKNQTRHAIQAWADLANITFKELPKPTPSEQIQELMGKHQPNDHRIVFAHLPPNHKDNGFHSSDGAGHHSSSAMLGMSKTDADFEHDSFKRGVLTRVIGNAIGLKSPVHISTKKHTDNIGILKGDSAFHTKDNLDYTIMSQHKGKNSHITMQERTSDIIPNYLEPREENRPSAPMMHDIAAVQKMYGANMSTRNSDTTYGFNSNSGRDFLSLNTATDKALFCIWDGGGNDTLDFSGFSQNQKINLYERSFSDVGGMKGNVSIAKGVTLENAVGGAGDDLLIGNHADNRLKGGAGADRLEGGNGADTFIYDNAGDSTPEHPDLITDFTSESDKIDLSGALRNSGTTKLSFVPNYTGKPGDAVLSYDRRSGRGSLAVDLTGNGQPDLLINTVGQIRPGDVLTSTLPKSPMAETLTPKSNLQPSKNQATQRAAQAMRSTDGEVNKNVAHFSLTSHTVAPSVYSQVPDVNVPTTIVSVSNGNWNHYALMPKQPKDNDIVVLNSTATFATKVILPSPFGKTHDEYIEIKPNEKHTFKYSAESKTWSTQTAGDKSHWAGSKVFLGTGDAKVSFDWRNWRPEARLPADGIDGDILHLKSDAIHPIDIKTPNVNDPTVWQLTKGDALDFQYSAQSGEWKLLRKPGQFYSPQTLADGALPSPSTWRTYVEVSNGDWRESITLPTKNVREGHQVIVNTTADQSFRIKTGQANYTLQSGETVSFRADKKGQYVREAETSNLYDNISRRARLDYFKNNGTWPKW
ncbi:M10 family metallopeptidase C-terminal domain-containing protein [Pseudomonas sp. NS1(2017)]|uniref:M10 family metallopeptidase C-terminal domain-containing protein n=1 Tax=Pseudomonas sp. NS1(2017) TaxID=2025658 RepID=UPI0021145D3C|nr:M10 family metallopeptidase C-terminal domain-containing protein [Pseudomonas sp. NS1(2017)]